MLINKMLYERANAIVSCHFGGYFNRWTERVANLDCLSASDADTLMRSCAQIADAADAAATLTGHTPLGDGKSWRDKVEEALYLSSFNAMPVFMACAERADALESFWQAVMPRAGVGVSAG